MGWIGKGVCEFVVKAQDGNRWSKTQDHGLDFILMGVIEGLSW